MKKAIRSEESGFTLIEVMVVAGLFVVSMVVLMGSLLTIIRQGEIADKRVAAINLNRSTFDFMRGADWEDLVDFAHPVTDPVTGIAYVDGLGDVDIRMWAIIPSSGSGPGGHLLLGSSEIAAFDPEDVPNPVEIQIEIETLSPTDPRLTGSVTQTEFQTETQIDPETGLVQTETQLEIQTEGWTPEEGYKFRSSIMHAH